MSRRRKKPESLSEDTMRAASMTECTGILPAQVQTDDQAENVAELENIFPPLPPD